MKRWEYTWVEPNEALNVYGSQGWEAVGMFVSEDSEGFCDKVRNVNVLMKRELQDEISDRNKSDS